MDELKKQRSFWKSLGKEEKVLKFIEMIQDVDVEDDNN